MDGTDTDRIRARIEALDPVARARLEARLRTGELRCAASTSTLSDQQRNFWTLHRLAAQPAAFNAAFAFRLTGALDTGRLQRAFRAVVRTHAIFRTVYREHAGGLSAVVREDLEAPFAQVTHDVAEADFLPRVLAAAQSEALRPFDLTAESAVRACLYRRTGTDHVLLLLFHHIANDGRTVNLFWTALVGAYAALERGVPVPEPAQESRYAAYVERQRRQAAQPGAEAALEYWLDQLRDAPSAVPFPYDFPGGGDAAATGAEIRLPLQGLDARAAALARDLATTANAVFLAAYFVWLYHHAGVRDAVVGVPVMRRTRPEDQLVVGCCINMLSIRQRIDPGASFRTLVGEIHRAVADGLRFAEAPFMTLVERRAQTGQGSGGLFNTTFQYQNFIADFEPLGDCTLSMHRPSRQLAQVPLMLELYPNFEIPTVGFCFDARHFRRESVARMLRRYLVLADTALENPDRPIAELDPMDADERALVTTTWSQGPQSSAPPASVDALFAEVARASPDAVALEWDDGTMSYAALDAAADRVAAGLRARDIGAGARVGVCLDRSPAMIVAFLGTLRAGAAYVPLDPAYPPARLALMVEDAGVPLVVTDARGRSRVRHLGATPLLVETLLATALQSHPETDSSPDAPAYLMYTSGSTGRPKGVLVPHRGIVRLVRGTDYVDLGPADKLLHLSSPSFDAATFEIWGALLNGGRAVLMPALTPSIRDIGAAIERHRVTVLWLTAGLFHLLVDEAVHLLRPLRVLLAGGDVLSPSHVRACLDACPDLELINGYGPTENTTFSLCYPIPRDFPADASVPIGRPIAGSTVYLLDDRRQPVPVGLSGELCVGGAGLAVAYWRRPELTAERFIPHPFADDPNARLYRTGDLARFLPDGVVEFLGRKDRQTKVRGFRIEPGEIEAALTAIAEIRQAVVTVTDAGDNLVAYIVPEAGDLSEADVQAAAARAVRDALPPYMHPGQWVVLDQLPLTANGKIDRAALPRPTASPVSTLDGPATPLEEELLAIWRRVFDTDAIGCSDDFFALGGNSMLAIRFVAEAERSTGKEVTLALLFQQPTIRRLARALETDARPDWSALVPLAPAGEGTPLVIVHGWAGDVFVFRPFAEAVCDVVPVYGLQGVELGGQDRFDAVAPMVAHYADELLAFRPEGPHYLLGYSVGGMIAFELAAELLRRGAAVGRVFVLDTHPGNLPAQVGLPARAGFLLHRLRRFIGRPAAWWDIARRWLARRRAGRAAGKLIAVGDQPFATMPHEDHYKRLGRRHKPRPCELPLTVLASSGCKMDLALAWRYLAGPDVEVVPIDAHHFSFMRGEGLERVVAAVRARLPQDASD